MAKKHFPLFLEFEQSCDHMLAVVEQWFTTLNDKSAACIACLPRKLSAREKNDLAALSEPSLLFGLSCDDEEKLKAFCAKNGLAIEAFHEKRYIYAHTEEEARYLAEVFPTAFIRASSLEATVCALLKEKNMTVALAESCTGGLIAKRITDQPGSSAVFGFGFVSYANRAKEDLLGVPHDILAAHGAVSPETAQAMAVGARKRGHADFGLAVTGIAGPDGGTPDKPVGLVYISLASSEGVWLRTLHPTADCTERDAIRDRTACHALDMLRCALCNLTIGTPCHES